MARWYFTDTPDVDWATVTWEDLPQFRHRYVSTAGLPLAQEEFDRRRAAGDPTVMWRVETNASPPVLVDWCNV